MCACINDQRALICWKPFVFPPLHRDRKFSPGHRRRSFAYNGRKIIRLIVRIITMGTLNALLSTTKVQLGHTAEKLFARGQKAEHVCIAAGRKNTVPKRPKWVASTEGIKFAQCISKNEWKRPLQNGVTSPGKFLQHAQA